MDPRLKHVVFSACQHPVKVYKNGYSFYVNCGKCVPCLKQRGDMLTSRVMREFSDNPFAYFFTLTYDNANIPLVRFRKDVGRWIPDEQVPCVPYNVCDKDDSVVFRYAESQMLDEKFDSSSFYPRINNYKRDFCFGVVSKVDVIKFLKRLRSNLNAAVLRSKLAPLNEELRQLDIRYGRTSSLPYSTFYSRVSNNKDYRYEKEKILLRKKAVRKCWQSKLFRYFVVAEYGPDKGKGCISHHRPHYHGILFCQDETVYRLLPRAFRKSWSKCSSRNMSISPVESNQACGYVAKYVTGNTSLPEILQDKLTRTFCLSSRCAAIGSQSYTYEKLQEMYTRGVIKENYRTYKRDGSFVDYDVSVPSGVLSRYFPKCKGYGSLSRSSKLRVYSRFDFFRDDLSKMKDYYKGFVFYPRYQFDKFSGKNVIARPADIPLADVMAARACAKWCYHFNVTPDHYLDILDFFYYKKDMEKLEQQFLLNEVHPDVISDISFFDDLPLCLDPLQSDNECLSSSNTILELRFSPLGELIRNYTGRDVSWFYDDAGFLDQSRVNMFFEYGREWYSAEINRINDDVVLSNKSKVFNDDFIGFLS